jgi:hypothetical protein
MLTIPKSEKKRKGEKDICGNIGSPAAQQNKEMLQGYPQEFITHRVDLQRCYVQPADPADKNPNLGP